MLNDLSSPLSLLRTRRSCKPRDLIEPGPDPSQLRLMLEIAARSPDHGKLSPWRFLHVPADRRAEFGDMLEAAYRAHRPDAGRLEIEAAHRFARQAPTLVILLSSPVESAKIPQWEQLLSCGAVGMNLVHAAIASGFCAGWVTGWAAYSDQVLEAVGGREGERIAGFVFIGTAGAEPEERPRPNMDEIVSEWTPGTGLGV